MLHQLRPDCLQFHGSETPEFCASWQTAYVKAIPMGSIDDPSAYAAEYAGARGFLLDSNAAGRLGGSGDTFDWSRIPAPFDHPLILAGGLNAANIVDAVTRVRPYGVDVSSGVETDKGIKSRSKILDFMQAVRRADGDLSAATAPTGDVLE